MIISAHQCAYNPWLGYIDKILSSDVFVVMDDVQFEKNSFINRNKILQNNNEVMLTIPVKTKDYKTKTIKDIEVLDNNWQTKHLKSIEQSYKKSPHFDEVFSQLEPIYQLKSKYLCDYTNAYLEFICKYLEIETKIVFASELDIKSKKLDYVIELVKKLGGDTFIFGSQGKNYADMDVLSQNSIKAVFQEYKHPIYTQRSDSFHKYMGIIDLLFNEERNRCQSICKT